MSSPSSSPVLPQRCVRCQGPLPATALSDVCDLCTANQQLTLELAHADAERPALTPAGAPSSGRYECLELLGRGGMGEVYRARQTDLARLVALKVVLPERGGDPQFIARFQREAQALARLNHPHIVAIYDFGELDGRPFLAMEFVTGTSLRSRLRQGPLPVPDACDLGQQLCQAVAYAHSQGVVHRDLKPENILVSTTGQLKVADFGLAKLSNASTPVELTATGAILGTFRYMAPEQLAGDPDVDHRADIYSLGVVLYEMFTGRIPLGRFLPPSKLVDVPASFDAPLLRALAAEPERRWSTAHEFAAALEQAARATHVGTPASDDDAAPPVMPRGNLPASHSRLVGREDDQALLLSRLRTQRWVTLTGPGGTGKTRLALQAGQDVSEAFADGVWFVPLAELTDPRHVPAAVAAALGIREDARETWEAVRQHLAPRQSCLILDNFEQLLAAAPLLSELLAAAPRLHLLVTSRVALRRSGEVEFPVGPLEVPDAAALSRAPSLAAASPAVQLFLERARQVRPDFTLTSADLPAVVDICRRLDGLPLAIELAAARIKLLSPTSLAARLSSRLKILTGGPRDLPARQQTMRAAIAWSYELLTPAQRTLLAWLCPLRGSFTVDGAERLVGRLTALGDVPLPAGGERLDESDVLDALTTLLDHHLLRQAATHPTPRFAFYETIREFAEEQWPSAAWTVLRHAHAEWCLEKVSRDEPELTSSDPSRVLLEWDSELADFRAALAWWRGAGARPDDALRILGELWYYWVLRGQCGEGIEEARAATEHPGVTRDTPAFSRALHALGTLCYLRDRPQEARTALERALEIRRRHEPEESIYGTLGNLASVKRACGDLQGAIQDLQESLAFRRRRGDRRTIAVALSNLSLTHQFLGQWDEAQAGIAECLQIYRELQDRRGLSRQYLNLGRLEHARGRFNEALTAFLTSRDISRELDDRGGLVNARLAVANSLTALERFDEAGVEFAACQELMLPDEPASRLSSWHIARGYYHWRRGQIAAALADYRDSLRLRLACDDKYGIGETLVVIVDIYVHQQRFRDAARLLGAERELRQQIGYRFSTQTSEEVAANRQQIDAALGAEAAQAAYDEGRRATLTEIIQQVLEADQDGPGELPHATRGTAG
ncbi:MAG: protein kinase [Pirellulales bacterium]